MNKTVQIIRHELFSIFSRKSYLVFLFLVPFIGTAVYGVAALINRGIAPEGIQELFSPTVSNPHQAIVNHSGIIQFIPDEVSSLITLAASEEEALQWLRDGKIASFFVLSEDYLETGKVDFIQKDYNFLATMEETKNFDITITINLFREPLRARRYLEPMNTRIIYLKEPLAKDFGGPENFWLPYAVMMLFYMLIIGASSLMLNSITSEKKNRVVEILLTSSSPYQLLVGKTIALGIAGVLQAIIWLISGYTLLRLASQQFSLPHAYILDASLLFWGCLFFILGYALYSSLMAGLGALVPNPKEGSQATIVVIFPLIIPLFFSNMVASAPNAPLLVVFSIFPLTSPISMLSRMSATTVPLWQVLLAVILLLWTIVVTMRVIVRMFRAQSLLSGKPFNAREYILAFFTKTK